MWLPSEHEDLPSDDLCLPSAPVTLAVRISSRTGVRCHSEDWLRNRVKQGCPSSVGLGQGSALWKRQRKIPEASRLQVAARPIPLLPGCYDNQSDMQIGTGRVLLPWECAVHPGIQIVWWQVAPPKTHEVPSVISDGSCSPATGRLLLKQQEWNLLFKSRLSSSSSCKVNVLTQSGVKRL